ncbi:hypothetical protein BGX26_010906 [Mortierella sp. AD094]|nr:hypothetical protein BGX26_010906 [Mortierella sp. AD094]
MDTAHADSRYSTLAIDEVLAGFMRQRTDELLTTLDLFIGKTMKLPLKLSIVKKALLESPKTMPIQEDVRKRIVDGTLGEENAKDSETAIALQLISAIKSVVLSATDLNKGNKHSIICTLRTVEQSNALVFLLVQSMTMSCVAVLNAILDSI